MIFSSYRSALEQVFFYCDFIFDNTKHSIFLPLHYSHFSHCPVENNFRFFVAMKVFLLSLILSKLLIIQFVILFCRVNPVKPWWQVHPQQSKRHQRHHLLPRNNLPFPELFGELCTTESTTKPLSSIIQEDIASCKATGCIPVDANPLSTSINILMLPICPGTSGYICTK